MLINACNSHLCILNVTFSGKESLAQNTGKTYVKHTYLTHLNKYVNTIYTYTYKYADIYGIHIHIHIYTVCRLTERQSVGN